MITTSGAPTTAPRQTKWRHRLRLAVRVLLALVLIGTVTAVLLWRHTEATTCAPAVKKIDGECIGLTRDYPFTDDLVDVTAAIARENSSVDERVARSDGELQVATIVYLLPITVREHDITNTASVRHEIEGAYLAQHDANRAEGTNPLIRLMLANTGSESKHWRRVAEQVVDRTDDDRIVAVAGLGASTPETHDLIDMLADNEIAMVGSVITADSLSNIPGLVRVSPPNADEVAAGLTELRDTIDSALLITDIRDDPYSVSLAEAFNDQMVEAHVNMVSQTETYDSSLPGPANRFPQIVQNICELEPDLVYFAGRSDQLNPFIVELSHRRCRDVSVHVLTGDDASILAAPPIPDSLSNALKDQGLTIEFTTLAHPRAWEDSPDEFLPTVHQTFTEPDSPFRNEFGDDSLDDGMAIMAYDAVTTAVKAARQAQGQSNHQIRSGELIQQWGSLHGGNEVSGASGAISLCNNGNPHAKVMPVLQLTDQSPTFSRLAIPPSQPGREGCPAASP